MDLLSSGAEWSEWGVNGVGSGVNGDEYVCGYK